MLKLSLRREEWEAIREVGRRWFGKEGARYSLTIPRMIEEFFLNLHRPPVKGAIAHSVEVREDDVKHLRSLADMLNCSMSDALRALLYQYEEAPVALFVKPEDIPYKHYLAKSPPKEYGESLMDGSLTEAEWRQVCESAKFTSYLERRGLLG